MLEQADRSFGGFVVELGMCRWWGNAWEELVAIVKCSMEDDWENREREGTVRRCVVMVLSVDVDSDQKDRVSRRGVEERVESPQIAQMQTQNCKSVTGSV